ncbi:MAG: DUF308 domain-containing protein [Deltaproteobacteria bacterium]|nr:DUF308 domain-containing protein [Deltaproteobacteria bacterium]
MVVLGTAGLGLEAFLTLASVLYFGLLLVVAGVVQLGHGLLSKQWRGRGGALVIGALYLLAGVAVIADPLAASAVLTLILAAVLVVVGVSRLAMALQHRDLAGWGWGAVSGGLAVLLGLMIAARWPVSGLWVIGLFVAIELILHGWTYIMLALAARRA